jgi:hypothetical protein
MRDHLEAALYSLPVDRELTVFDFIGKVPPRRRPTVREASSYMSRLIREGRLRCVGSSYTGCYHNRQYRRA